MEKSGDRATLRFAEQTTGGWSAARDVASGSDWFVNWADVPSVVRLDDGTLAAHWLQKSGADTYAYDV
ncbi:MAG: exo-alpha-sialidase, partial [Vicinamibacterales bacterium]